MDLITGALIGQRVKIRTTNECDVNFIASKGDCDMRDRLTQILEPYENATDSAERESAEAKIWADHGRNAVAFVLDLAGFTSGVAEIGLIGHLARVNGLLMKTEPIIAARGGTTIKHEADNCFAIFDDVGEAVAAAEACFEMLASHGTSGGVGIAYGPILFTGDDFYGYAVNVASKLGEDMASAGEILIEAGAAAMLVGDSNDPVETREKHSGNVVISAVVHYSLK